MSELMALPNIGKTLAEKLVKVGITTVDELGSMGSVDAFLKIKVMDASACYNMLYALEGAIRNVRWHELSKADRASLMMQAGI